MGERKNIIGVNKLRLRQNGCHFPDHIFKVIFLNENCCILVQIPLKFETVIQHWSDDVWHRTGNKPLSEAKMT